jgi:peptidoglycan/LPS O-acetylase OafA/YrhL
MLLLSIFGAVFRCPLGDCSLFDSLRSVRGLRKLWEMADMVAIMRKWGVAPMSVPTMRPPLPILTSLRFFAAAEVVAFHGDLPWQTDVFRGLTSAGNQAVTFFFVLSGFILTYVYTGTSEHIPLNVMARAFWKARFARISPAYCLGLLLSFPTFAYSALISKIMPIKSLILGLALVPTLQQAWWPPASNLWNAPAWSLSVEFFFYVLFPALAWMTARVPRKYFIAYAYCSVIAMTICRFSILSPDSLPESFAWNFEMFSPPLHLPQFIFGMALGRLYLFGPIVSRKIHVAMLCIGIVGLVFVFGGRSLLPWWTRTDGLLVLLFGMVIFGGARAEEAVKVLSSPSLILMGEASYSIYMLHMPLQFWWGWFMQKVLRLSLPVFPNFVLYCAFVIAGSLLSYLYVEKPLRRWILGHREHRDA